MIQGGVNLIDTAPNYGNHSSEQIVGKAIQGLNRSEIYISTKFGTHNDLFTGGVFRDARFGTVMEEMASSLRNLQTDYVDFYFLHWPDTHTPIAETMCALNFLKQQGQNPLYRLIQLRSDVIGGSDEIRPSRRHPAALLDDRPAV